MSILLLVAILCTGSALSQVQVPCYGEGCANVTVYLGPRWGSRVIMVPRTETTARPGAENKGESIGHRYEHEEENRPQYRPVPPGGVYQVDFLDDESSSKKTTRSPFSTTRNPYKSNIRWWDTWITRRPWDTTSTSRPWGRTPTSRPWVRTYTDPPTPEVELVVDKYDRGTLDLSWRGYSGEDVKQVFKNLSEADRSRVNRLILYSNRIRHLPVLVFPVEFEYGLQELSLNNNPFRPTFITSYTRFELSRLARLKTLNMTNCGITSIEMPDLPSLEVLDLSYNELYTLPHSLARLGNLLQLFLRGNHITYISDYPLSSLTNLWLLDLGSNGLRDILDEPLENIRSLVTIKLDNNQLRSLPLFDFERTIIVSIANNSLECSCSLLHWISWHNGTLQNDYFESCQEENQTIPLQDLREWPVRYEHLCDPGWWGDRARTAAVIWYNHHPNIISDIYKVVGVMVVAVAVALLVLLKRQKRLTGKTKPHGIPYNILDEQQVSTVSGPQVDV